MSFLKRYIRKHIGGETTHYFAEKLYGSVLERFIIFITTWLDTLKDQRKFFILYKQRMLLGKT